MSKKKDYYNYNRGGMYDQERNNDIADHLEEYIYAIQNLFILEGKKVSEVKKAITTVEKAIKHLRKGKPEKVYDEERFEEYFDE